MHAANTEQILSRMKEQLTTSYAYTGFVCSWERYRKIVKLNPTSYAEASEAFELDQYGQTNGRVLFESHFPGSHVHTWPTNPTAQYWFASNLRNSIAHGQIYVIDNLVTLYNINKKGVADFEFTMPAQKFGNLVRGCLETLLANIGPPEWRITAPKLYDIKTLYD